MYILHMWHKGGNTVSPAVEYYFGKVKTSHSILASEFVSSVWGKVEHEAQVAFYLHCGVHREGEGFWYEYWTEKQETRHPGLKHWELK